MIIIDAFLVSDFIGQAICLILCVMSAWFWSVAIVRHRYLRKNFHRNQSFLTRYCTYGHPLGFYIQSDSGRRFRRDGNPMIAIYVAASESLSRFLEEAGASQDRLAAWQKDVDYGPILPPAALATVRARTEAELQNAILALEKDMHVVATCASAAPSLGLFGTVWGIMCAFWGMYAGGGTILIQSVAPGISSALLTTVLGLIVAIPASWYYNVLNDAIRKQTVQLENFADNLLADVFRYHEDKATHPQASAAAASPIVIQTPAYPVPAYAAPTPTPAPAPMPSALPEETPAPPPPPAGRFF